MGGMFIAGAMEQWGLHRRIALTAVARIGTSPRRIVLGFMLATGFITLWISNTATALMMFPIGMTPSCFPAATLASRKWRVAV